MAAVPPEFARRDHIKKFTVLYDVTPILFPQFFNERQVWFDDLLQSFNERDYYFAISANTRKDFLRYCPHINPDHIQVTHIASANTYSRMLHTGEALREKYKIPSGMNYVFSLSNLEPRKNLHMALKSFAVFIKKHKIMDLCFVLGGTFWKNYAGAYEDLLKELDVPPGRIVAIGYVDDADVAGLLSNAQWLVYTSKYEGFGMPPLEAMQCGCPVITSNNSSLPEVVGDAGLMIDCDSEEQHIQAYEQYYFDHELRNANILKGLERAKNFTWDTTFALMRKAILEII
jgi:glycosyltransferase involved in cell wall biosynthesis